MTAKDTFIAYLSDGKVDSRGGRTSYSLTLPSTKRTLTNCLKKVGTESYVVTGLYFIPPWNTDTLTRIEDVYENVTVEELNRFVDLFFKHYTEEESDYMKTIFDGYDKNLVRYHEVLVRLEHYDEFEFFPYDSDYHSDDYAIGKLTAEQHGGVTKLPREILEKYFDYEEYGCDLYFNTEVEVFSNGYILPKVTVSSDTEET